MIRRALLVSCLALALGCRSHRGATVRRHVLPPATVDLRAGVDTRLLEQYARTQRFGQGRPTRFKFTPAGDAVLFLRTPEGSGARALYTWERSTRTERVLATAEQLLGGGNEELSPEERARRERARISGRGVTTYELSPDGARVLVPLSGRLFVLERSSGAAREIPVGTGPVIDPRFSPDGRYVSLVHRGELEVVDVTTGAARRLTAGAHANLTHAVAEFIAQEELNRMEGYWWSPDGTQLVYQETDLTGVERLRLSDPSHPERPPDEPAYPRVGSANAVVKLGLVPAAGGLTRWVTWDREAFPYLATVRWTRNAPLTLVVLNRAQTEARVLTVNPTDGATREIHRERDDAWVNVDQDYPAWSHDGRTFLWATERGGQWQIEERDAQGQNARWITPATATLRDLVRYDSEHRTVYVLHSEEPTESHLARVSLDAPSQLEPLTRGAAEHEAYVSEDGSLQVRVTRTLTTLPRVTVHDASGAELGAITSTTEAPVETPRVEFRTVGPENFRVAVVRPSRVVAGRRYPVILWVYGGPHSQLVAHTMERYVTQQWLADQGFVVVLADGRGTRYRGRAWERAIHLQLGDIPLVDQVQALQALGERDPTLDLRRVGVIGWSFGAYLAARAVIERPDVFHAAVAGAPVTDWREYDTCYTERYLGLVDAHADAYERASLIPHAATLQRPLLIVHGTADDNVYFHNGLKLADALFRAGRSFEFLPLAGQTHLVNDPSLVVAWMLRARAFFVDHLRPR